MLRHPFFGVIDPAAAESDDRPAADSGQSSAALASGRRGFFRQALAGLAGFGGMLLLGRSAVAQGGRSSFDAGYSGQSGGSFRGGLGGDSFGDPGPRYRGGGGVTTYAIGEEGSYYYRRPYYRYYRPYYPNYYYRRPRYTTYALGEEGGW